MTRKLWFGFIHFMQALRMLNRLSLKREKELVKALGKILFFAMILVVKTYTLAETLIKLLTMELCIDIMIM